MRCALQRVHVFLKMGILFYMKEDCHIDKNFVTLPYGLKKLSNLRKIGDDVEKGDVIVKKGQRIQAQHIGLCASQNLTNILVYSPLKIAFLSTGNEIGHDVADSNKPTLMAIAKQWGYEAFDAGHVRDDILLIKAKLDTLVDSFDIIITTGGASVGDGDYMKSVLETTYFSGINIKPGRPVGLGLYHKKLLLLLPGNPVAAYTCMVMIARFLLAHMQGQNYRKDYMQKVKSSFSYTKKLQRKEFVRVTIHQKEHHLWVNKYGKSGAGVLSSLRDADGFAVLGEEKKIVEIGDEIDYIDFRMMNE